MFRCRDGSHLLFSSDPLELTTHPLGSKPTGADRTAGEDLP
jgi:hypothetical protein